MKSCYEKALDLLARRSHFQAELAHKLAARGFAEGEIATALARLKEAGYLDDERTAEELVATRLARQPEGRRRLQHELARRGVAPETIQGVLAQAVPEDDLPAAREAAARWQRKGGQDPRALARFLDRKGFSRRAIYALVEEVGSGEE